MELAVSIEVARSVEPFWDFSHPADEEESIKVSSASDYVKRIVEVYERWHQAEPDVGHDAQVAKWKAMLTKVPISEEEELGATPDPPRRD